MEHFHKSTLATNCLREKLDLSQHVLVTECKTHWSLTYHMLECVQKQQAAICAVLAETRTEVFSHYCWKMRSGV